MNSKNYKKIYMLSVMLTVTGILLMAGGCASSPYGNFMANINPMISNANESQKKTDASTVDNACKSYYAAILSGSFNSSSYDAGKVSDLLPSPDAAPSERKTAALACTIGNALVWNGTPSLSQNLDAFGADTHGNIYAKSDTKYSSELTNMKLTAGTTFSELGYSNTDSNNEYGKGYDDNYYNYGYNLP